MPARPKARGFVEENRQHFSNLLLRMRGDRSQAQVSKEADIPPSTLSLFEKGPFPSVNLIDFAAILRYYGITPNEAFELLGLFQPRASDVLVDAGNLEMRAALRTLPTEQRQMVYAAIHGMIAGLQKGNPPTSNGQGIGMGMDGTSGRQGV